MRRLKIGLMSTTALGTTLDDIVLALHAGVSFGRKIRRVYMKAHVDAQRQMMTDIWH